MHGALPYKNSCRVYSPQPANIYYGCVTVTSNAQNPAAEQHRNNLICITQSQLAQKQLTVHTSTATWGLRCCCQHVHTFAALTATDAQP